MSQRYNLEKTAKNYLHEGKKGVLSLNQICITQSLL